MSVKRTTHCKYMHPLSGGNLYVSPSGKRFCKACKRAYKAAYRLKKGHVPRDLTRCKRGHPFDAENTVIKKSGQRKCRTCMTAYDKAYRVKRGYEEANAKRRKPGGLADRHHTAGAEAERAAIVAWLRSQGGHHDDIYAEAADDIEAGAHRKDYQVQQGEDQ
jgi:hypothetical protein